MWPQCHRTPHCGQTFQVVDLLLHFQMFWSTPSLHADPPCSLPTAMQILWTETYMWAFSSLDFTRKLSWITALAKWCLFFSLSQDLTSGSHSYFQFPSLLEFPSYQRLWDSSFHKIQTPQSQDLAADTAVCCGVLDALDLCWFEVECF